MTLRDQAVQATARIIAQAALDWTDAESLTHDHDLECTNWTAYTGDAAAALDAALDVLCDEEALAKVIEDAFINDDVGNGSGDLHGDLFSAVVAHLKGEA